MLSAEKSGPLRIIIRTYELPPKLEKRITGIAERRVEELLLSNPQGSSDTTALKTPKP